MTVEEYKKQIEEESIQPYKRAERIDKILEEAEKDENLSEAELDELWDFADNFKV